MLGIDGSGSDWTRCERRLSAGKRTLKRHSARHDRFIQFSGVAEDHLRDGWAVSSTTAGSSRHAWRQRIADEVQLHSYETVAMSSWRCSKLANPRYSSAC